MACLAFAILNLCFFKYFPSIKDSFDAFLVFFGFGYLNADIIFPIGISFYTFASITYLVSVYKNKKIETFLNLATYLSFFPTLLMGPIMRSEFFFEQIHQKREFKNANLIIVLLLFGIVKKVLIANYLGIYSKEILSNPAALAGNGARRRGGHTQPPCALRAGLRPVSGGGLCVRQSGPQDHRLFGGRPKPAVDGHSQYV